MKIAPDENKESWQDAMSLMKTLALIFLSIGLSVSKLAAQNSVDAAAIDSYLNPYVQSGNFAGDVLIEKNGSVIFEKAYGFADREKGARNSSATRFHIASVSMQFTAAAILRLVDKGSISLSTQVSEVVTGITGGDKITIRDLLLERLGLP